MKNQAKLQMRARLKNTDFCRYRLQDAPLSRSASQSQQLQSFSKIQTWRPTVKKAVYNGNESIKEHHLTRRRSLSKSTNQTLFFGGQQKLKQPVPRKPFQISQSYRRMKERSVMLPSQLHRRGAARPPVVSEYFS